MRIIVSGLVGLHPIGGVAWDYLQYVIGFHRMGHDVYYYEDTWSWPFNPMENRQVESGDYSAQFIDSFFKTYEPDLCNQWQYVHLHSDTYGLNKEDMDKIVRSTDLFINVSGANIIPENLKGSCRTVFIDTDPGYNQIVMREHPAWSENVERWHNLVSAHDLHFTYAENINHPSCGIPDVGIDWIVTRMPIVSGLWTNEGGMSTCSDNSWFTIMTWNAFKGPLIHKGVEYGSKGEEFESIMELPTHLDGKFKIAIGGKTAPNNRLQKSGWTVLDGPKATLTPESYQKQLLSSRGEISTAKNVYVALKTGWFSCRSACFLAAGRPVVVQDTGFSDILPVGKGIVAFTDLSEAVEGIKNVESDYTLHSQIARQLAVTEFGYETVLNRFLSDVNM